MSSAAIISTLPLLLSCHKVCLNAFGLWTISNLVARGVLYPDSLTFIVQDVINLCFLVMAENCRLRFFHHGYQELKRANIPLVIMYFLSPLFSLFGYGYFAILQTYVTYIDISSTIVLTGLTLTQWLFSLLILARK